jgi:predicted PurR-regulated permease PerM
MGFKLDVAGAIDSINKNANSYLLGQFGNALSLGLAALGTLLQVVLMFIVAFLFALDATAIQRQLRRVVPSDYRHDFDLIWRKVRRMLYAYMRGQLVIAAMIGVLSGVACALLGLPFAVALGLVAGATALIPYLGPFVGAVPAIRVGLAISPLSALEVAIAYFVISNVILNFVYPKIVGDAVRLPPVMVIIAFIAGFSLAGILGMFVAIPVAATIAILFDHVYLRVYGTEP